MRAAGAVILGKTVTCEFAGMTPGITTNPHDVARTPGGSSSGSGAAVADWMAPVAFGTQTGGSVLRPASYCGVFGFKPTFGAFNRRGVFPAAESLDTIGLLARSFDDIELLSDVLELRPAAQPVTLTRAPRIGLCRTPLWTPHSRKRSPPSRTRPRGSARPARRSRRSCCRRNLPACATPRARPSTTTSAPPRWRTSGTRTATRSASGCASASRSAAPRRMRTICAALRLGEDCRARLGDVFDGCDVLLTPAANGEAPVGLGETGDPGFQAIWTILYTPALTLPTHRGPNGMPVGIQLVAQPHEDRRLFACARWVWQQLGAPELVGTR